MHYWLALLITHSLTSSPSNNCNTLQLPHPVEQLGQRTLSHIASNFAIYDDHSNKYVAAAALFVTICREPFCGPHNIPVTKKIHYTATSELEDKHL